MRGKMQKVGRQAALFAARARPLPGRSPSLPACATTALRTNHPFAPPPPPPTPRAPTTAQRAETHRCDP
jgi:hypothetical protein